MFSKLLTLMETFWLLTKPNTTPRLHVERMSHTHTHTHILLNYFTCAAFRPTMIKAGPHERAEEKGKLIW